MASVVDAPARPETPSPGGGWPAVWLVAGVHLALLLVFAGRYGYHRDELYFLEAGRHLAWGYVDQPPLVAVLARVQDALLGGSVASIRLVPALVSAGTVVLAAVLARELGGDRRARIVAAAAVAGAGFVLSIGHLLSTATFDLAFWVAAIVVVARMLRTEDPRWWAAIGGVVGLALWNKHLVVVLVVAVLAGLVADRRWRLLAPGWLLLGGAIALVLALPTLWWQAANDWPQLAMADALSARLGTENRIMLLPLQVLLLGPLLLPLMVAGVRWLWRREAGGARFRPFLWAYGAALVITFASGGRPYYPLPLGLVVVVAGAVALRSWSTRALAALLAASALTAIPIALPVIPAALQADLPLSEVNDTLVETIGWPELAAQVAGVVDGLPAEDRDDVVLLAASYGEAGALDRYGPALGLPEVYSGHNSYWHWRRPTADDATVVAVRLPEDLLAEHFEHCRLAGRVDVGPDVDNEAQGQPIWVCDGLRGTWAERWPAFRRYR